MPQLVVLTTKLRELIHCNASKEAQLQECDQLDKQFDELLHVVGRLALVGDNAEMLGPLKGEAQGILLRF
ncbi:MAG: hypothetical protein K2Y22_04375 [Candidatus Obscuribacterales bacterium]|nr:hypothetical protein [Candidatus Obscuribacterales bacterium]